MQCAGNPVGHFGGADMLGQQAEGVGLVVTDNGRIRTQAALNQSAVEPFAAAVFGNTVQLFAGIFAVEIADFFAPGGFAFGCPLFTQTQADAAVQALLYRFIKCDAVDGVRFFTGANIGKQLAVVLDDKVYTAPYIRVKIPDGSAYIEGMSDMEEAKDIAIVLRAGALPAPMTIVEERTVGPSLGKDSIAVGIRVGIFAL